MKGAIVILLMLLMGRLTAQSFDTHGYELKTQDTVFLQKIFTKLEKTSIDAYTIQKFATHLDYFPAGSREDILLHEIYIYAQSKVTIYTNNDTYPVDFIELLGSQF